VAGGQCSPAAISTVSQSLEFVVMFRYAIFAIQFCWSLFSCYYSILPLFHCPVGYADVAASSVVYSIVNVVLVSM
jgi:hypothetical protein